MAEHSSRDASWEIESIDSKRTNIVLKSGNSTLQFYAVIPPPTSWAVGDKMSEPEVKDENRSKALCALKNLTRGGLIDAHLIGGSGDIMKSLGQAPVESAPVLDTPLRITGIYSDNVIEVEDRNSYLYTPELDLESNYRGWREGQRVIVSKAMTGYRMENIDTKKSIVVSLIKSD